MPLEPISQVTTTLPISSYLTYFQPMVLPTPEGAITPTAYITITNGIVDIFKGAGPYGATVFSWLVNDVLYDYYLTLRIGMTAFVFVVGFVMRRLKLGRAFGNEVVVSVGESFRNRLDRPRGS